MQRLSESLPRISYVAGWGGRAVIGFQTSPRRSLLQNGCETQPTNVVRSSEGQSYFQRSSGPACRAGMSVPVEDMISLRRFLVARRRFPLWRERRFNLT